MEFDEVTFPSTAPSAATSTESEHTTIRMSKRKQYRSEKYGNWAPSTEPQGKLKSNNKNYWDKDVQCLPQFVGIVRLGPVTTTREADSIGNSFTEALKNLNTGTNAQRGVPTDPVLRSWTATTGIMKRLNGRVDKSLMDAIQRDIAWDEQKLEAAGMPSAALGAGLLATMDKS